MQRPKLIESVRANVIVPAVNHWHNHLDDEVFYADLASRSVTLGLPALPTEEIANADRSASGHSDYALKLACFLVDAVEKKLMQPEPKDAPTEADYRDVAIHEFRRSLTTDDSEVNYILDELFSFLNRDVTVEELQGRCIAVIETQRAELETLETASR